MRVSHEGGSVLVGLSRRVAQADVIQEVAYSSPVLNLALQREPMQLLGGLCQGSLVEEAVVARVEAVQVRWS